jgi:hypothetical protein
MSLFDILGSFEKLWKATMVLVLPVYPSVCPFAWKNSASTRRIFIKLGTSFIKIWQVFYKRMCVYLRYLAEFFLEWEIFRRKVVEKIKTHILYSITFSRKSCRLWDNVEKWGRARQATDENIIRRMRVASRITKTTQTNTHTHSEYVILINLQRQKWFGENVSVLRYPYFASVANYSAQVLSPACSR